MHQAGGLFSQAALGHALAGILGLLVHHLIDFGFIKLCEHLEICLGAGVGQINPELVELSGAGFGRVEPDGARFALAELFAGRLV